MRVDAVFRGRIATWDPARPSARAMAVHLGRVVAFDNEAEELARDARRREDFGEAALFPGFHDAHCHTTAFGLGLSDLDLSSPPLRSLDELYRVVATAAAGAGPGEWVVGSGYDQNKLGGHPRIERLDEIAPGHPVWLRHTSGHMCVVSSAALELIGPAATRPVDGGRVVLDERSGRPTGLLEERAQSLVQHLVLPRSLETLAAAIGAAHERYLADGITSVCDAGAAGGLVGQSPVELAAYQLARETGQLKVRTTVMPASEVLGPVSGHEDDWDPPAGVAALGLPGGARTGLGDDWLRLGPVKVFADGSLIGRTCWMEEGFDDDRSNTGYPQDDPDRLRSVIVGAHLAGWQVATHAIGDAAVAFVLRCYEEALALAPRRDHRHRIEHCGVMPPTSLARLAALGVIPVPQARFVGELGDGMAAALGPVRARYAYRLRSVLEAGAVLPGSSDRPVVEGRPLAGIADMVCRRTESGALFGDEAERLAPEEALRAYSHGSAVADRVEADRGSLRPGQLADAVVLAADPRAIAGGEIAWLPVLATLVGGELAFDAR